MTDTSAIRTIHQISCRAHKRNGGSGKCNCTPSYMPEPWDAATGRKVRGPLSHWAKGLMMIQAGASLLLVVLVTARADNVL